MPFNLWDRYVEALVDDLPGIPRDELLGYLEVVAQLLDRLHLEYQVQHGDIKPRCLYLIDDQIQIADLDLAKSLPGRATTLKNGSTPLYTAPEMFDGVVTRFCDQYSLAIVYQEMLTGHRPFKGGSLQQVILEHLRAVPDLSPLPLGDRPPVARALSKRPEDRYPSSSEFIQALRAATSSG